MRRKRNVPIIRPPAKAATRPKWPALGGNLVRLPQWTQYWIKDPLEGALEFAAYYLFRVLPVSICSEIGALRGRFTGSARREAEKHAQNALRIISSTTSPAQVDALLRQLHRNSGRALLETLVMDRIWKNGRVIVQPASRINVIGNPQQARIFVSVHTGNLGDLLGMCLMQLSGFRGMTVSRRQPNRFRQRLSERLRSKHGAAVLEPSLRTTRLLLRHLRDDCGAVLIHLDEARGRQVYFPTFGRPMPYGSNLSLAIRLAAATGTVLTPVYLKRNTKCQFELHIEDDIAPVSPDDEDGQAALAHMLDQLFEAVVRDQLHDWQQLYFVRAGASPHCKPVP